MFKVAVIVGSLRRESINRRFAQALARLAEGTLEFELVELGDVPMYNEDLWQNPPPAVTRLKQAIEAADAVLFVTCLLYTSPSPRDGLLSRMPSSA